MDQKLTLDKFPWTVIESPRNSFYSQSKVAMRVPSKEQGGFSYKGLQIVCPERWEHILVFYILEPVELGIYIATSLHDRFHYQVKWSEQETILGRIFKFCNDKSRKKKCRYVVIGQGENYNDKNIIVVHRPSQAILTYLARIDHTNMIHCLHLCSPLLIWIANRHLRVGVFPCWELCWYSACWEMFPQQQVSIPMKLSCRGP